MVSQISKRIFRKMPEVKDFLAAWNLKTGSQVIDSYTVKIRAQHKILKRYQHYAFPIKMDFYCASPSTDEKWKTFRTSMMERCKTSHTILSRFGNPYACSLGIPHFTVARDRTMGTVEMIGDAVRIEK